MVTSGIELEKQPVVRPGELRTLIGHALRFCPVKDSSLRQMYKSEWALRLYTKAYVAIRCEGAGGISDGCRIHAGFLEHMTRSLRRAMEVLQTAISNAESGRHMSRERAWEHIATQLSQFMIVMFRFAVFVRIEDADEPSLAETEEIEIPLRSNVFSRTIDARV